MLRAALKLGATLAAAYGLLCLAVFLLQRRLQYFPERSGEEVAGLRATAAGLAPWRSPEGRLLGWRKPGAAAPLRVLVLPGNAGNALDRVYYLPLLEGLGAEGVLLEYPGYGPRPGGISQEALVAAGREALGLLAREGPVVLLGESLGSGVAVQVAAADPAAVRGLLLVTPYARMSDLGAAAYPWLPVRALLRDRWDSAAAIGSYWGPVALMLAGRDEVVGVEQGRALAAACRGPVRVWVQPEAGHNALSLAPEAGGWREALAFAAGR